jgi:thiamine biosynthesis lipoprotein
MTGALRTGGVTFRHTERVMGTVVSFDVRPQGLAYTATHAAIGEARRLLRDADDVVSLYRDDTPLNRLRRAELDLGQCPGEVGEVLAVCEQARDLSGGWFDPWALSGGFDPTGLVKGWAAQRAAKRLSDAGVGAAMVNAAGDISLFGSPDGEPWRIGIRSPEAADQILCVVAGA